MRDKTGDLFDGETESLSVGEIRESLREAEEMYALLLQEEPEEDSEEYLNWLDRLEALDDQMDEWREMLDEADGE